MKYDVFIFHFIYDTVYINQLTLIECCTDEATDGFTVFLVALFKKIHVFDNFKTFNLKESFISF